MTTQITDTDDVPMNILPSIVSTSSASLCALQHGDDLCLYLAAVDALSVQLYGKPACDLPENSDAAIKSMQESFANSYCVTAALQKVRLIQAKELWESFGDVPVDDDDAIEASFLAFLAGADRMEVWHWFEIEFSLSVAKDLMGLK